MFPHKSYNNQNEFEIDNGFYGEQNASTTAATAHAQFNKCMILIDDDTWFPVNHIVYIVIVYVRSIQTFH